VGIVTIPVKVGEVTGANELSGVPESASGCKLASNVTILLATGAVSVEVLNPFPTTLTTPVVPVPYVRVSGDTTPSLAVFPTKRTLLIVSVSVVLLRKKRTPLLKPPEPGWPLQVLFATVMFS